MAISLGQPVDEITHGLEGVKIDGHVEASEKKRNSVLHVGAGLGQLFAYEEHGHPDGPLLRQYPNLDYPDEREISGAQFFNGPVYTGYPAPVVNAQGCYSSEGVLPYSSEGVIYQNPVVEYNPVYNQNFYCSAPCTMGQFNYGYGHTYAYQVAPVEQYNMAAPLPHDGGVMTPEGSFMPYVYQHTNPEAGHGQLVPMAIAGPPPPYNNVPGFHSIPYPPVYTPHVLNAASPAWVQQPMNARTLNEESSNHVQLKSGFQQPTDGNLNITKPGSEKVDSRVHMADDKKHSRKQFGPGPLYGVPVPVKGAWVRAGHLQCANTSQPLKPFGGKNKAPGAHPLNVEQFNLANFSTEFEDAKHFIIKSFSDENVYRSIQHGVWASTPHGNKKLDAAYQDAQHRSSGKAKGCPVFLYFSVNGSGRFCGVAEMTGRVDFNTTMDFWERNRWCGSFPVKWHFVKDVPHCQLRRIILQNNENKPVTSSRDTQEVYFEQGLQMLNIIKSYSTTASILDNFPNLTGPEKVVPDVKIEQQPLESVADSRVAQESGVSAVLESSKAVKVEQRLLESIADSRVAQESGVSAVLESSKAVKVEQRPLESIADSRVAQESGVSAVLESSNALKACNGEAKARENPLQGKLNQGKAETVIQDSIGDKENARILELV